MTGVPIPTCAECRKRECRNGKDCFAAAERHLDFYGDERLARMHRAASTVEARHYCRATRLQEVALFAKELGLSKLGLAFCIGLADEAAVVAEVLGRDFSVVSACCKGSGIPK